MKICLPLGPVFSQMPLIRFMNALPTSTDIQL